MSDRIQTDMTNAVKARDLLLHEHSGYSF